jgi:hypothetical protein
MNINIDLSKDAYALNKVMEFDHPIRVNADGTVTPSVPGVYAPECHDEEGAERPYLSPGWEFVDGYSGQQGYSGPVMHSSEFIGGGMARDILAAPGVYVAVVVYWLSDEDEDSDDMAGWAVVRQA